ncbi:autotransporter outer membrane beta-barrel domain-containing protein [Haemophilus haemolyticus]|uniref:Autotransporter outer membrane beta-barrel domain-containing protein n=1 Tax=Haemophilus haemolyticus TaxID=726 RepID=A0A1B8PG17_HAEHA|nr:autotransporter outer membrane beta-barrel domain-containing protein [Haemophilus haemolyticus]OBX47878.1 autotransporter outer membrane beta-barrel domain-containing protein [Haemophilus haemolyticus]
MKQESQKQAKLQKKLLSILISSALSTTAFAANYPSINENKQISGELPIGHEVNDTTNIVTGDVNITVTPADPSKHTYPKAIIIRGDRTEEIEGKTNIAVTLASEGDPGMSPDSNASYGIAVGYDWNGEGKEKSILTLKDNATIHVDNTPDTKLGSRSFSGATAPFGHQLSGIRIYRKSSAHSTPILNSEKLLTINVEDKSTKKIGDYLVGIYIAGDGAEANLKDSNITVKANGKFSAALKIGKPELPNADKSDDYKGAVINSTGNMVLDTSETKDSAAVRLFGTKSRLIADSETSTGTIKSGNSAVVFDTQDYTTKVRYSFFSDNVSRNEPNKDQEVRLNNTKISTTSENASLIVADAKNVNSIAVSVAGSRVASWFNNGEFFAENAKFLLKGEQSEAKAANKGWLAETKLAKTKASDLTFTLDNKAKAIGLTHQHSRSGLTSKLDVTVDHNATWELAPKTDEAVQRATAYDVNLANGGILDASKHATGAGTDYKITLIHKHSDKSVNKPSISDGTVSIPEGEIFGASGTLINPDGTEKSFTMRFPLPITNAVLKITNGAMEFKSEDLGTIKLTKATFHLKKDTSLTTPEETTLLSGGTLTLSNTGISLSGTTSVFEKGTFTNGGIITLANQSYADKLTIEGNYVGNNGVLEVNTKWNTPGDYLGTNSESDLLTITGDASGNTTVKAIKTDGTEDVIDGSIGELADRYKRSVPVIKVLGDDKGTANGEINSTDATKPYAYNTRSTFTGTAKTTGAGELQLVSHKDDNGVTEYFWTLTTPNQDKTIITPSVPAYTLVPRQNLELGYTMLDTLHQRRGENQTLSWDKQGSYWQDVEKQSWGRLIGKHLKLNGKERFGLKTNMYGFQVGHDFDVKTKQDDEGKLTRRFTGLYFGALRSHSKFYDEYRAKNGVVIADKLTSRVKTTALNLGVTDTRYNENGTYIDWVGQLSWLNNRYSSVDGTQAKNHGWGAALSVETGRPYALGKDKTNNGDSWILEPQAQLIAQYLRLGNFNDGTRAVSQKGYGLRGRVGFRLAYNKPNDKQRTRTYYFIGNIWHDFKATGNALIGRDKLTEKFDRTWWELGLGSQFSLSENTYLYADARYEKSFDSNRHKGYQGTVGVKYSWK